MSKPKKSEKAEPEDDPQKWIDAYDRFRNELTAKQNSNSDNYDKSILTLSSAGLGLSLTFIKDITPIDRIASRAVLIESWGLFVGAIILTLVSFQCSQHAIAKALVDSHDYYVGRDLKAIERPNHWNSWTLWLGRIAGGCFILAIILTAYFVTTNLPKNKPDPAPAVVPTVAPPPDVTPLKPSAVPDKPANPKTPAPAIPAPPSSTATTVAPAPVTPPAAPPQAQSPSAAAPIPPKSP